MMYRSPWERLEEMREGFDRLFAELGGRPRTAQVPGDETEPQSIPINVFESENELVAVAPMPGIEPENIDVQIEDNYLTIRAEKRGPGQERHRYLRREWSYGPYERTIELPIEVDIERANATYGNGIVTIAMPKTGWRQARKIDITLEPVGATRGEHVGHRGTAEAGGGTETGPKGPKEKTS